MSKRAAEADPTAPPMTAPMSLSPGDGVAHRCRHVRPGGVAGGGDGGVAADHDMIGCVAASVSR